MFKNPILPGFYPDPSVCRVGEDYYLATSSFEYFPGVPIFHSRDLVHWRQVGYCLDRTTQLDLRDVPSSFGIWAPTLRHHEGMFYLITTNTMGGGHFIVTSRDASGDWSDPLWIEGAHHDPDLFFDEGRAYVSTHGGNRGILQWEIDLQTGKRISEVREIWRGFEDVYCEAPHLYKIHGMYYLLAAEGGTWGGHMVTVARSETMSGPFVSCPHNPILTHRHLVAQPVCAAGHGDLIEAHDGSWWLVHLGNRPIGKFQNLGRETFLTPVEWNEEGWPVVNGGKPTTEWMDVPTLPPHEWDEVRIRDEFDLPRLQPHWNFRRLPREADWSLTNVSSFLSLRCVPETLDQVGALFIGRRQCHHRFKVRAKLHAEQLEAGIESGIALVMNEGHHYEIALTRQGGEFLVLVRQRIGDLQCVVYEKVVSYRGSMVFMVEADEHRYHFGYQLSETENVEFAATTSAKYLSAEVADSFTGVFVGMYATANGMDVPTWVDYDWFDYEPMTR